MFTTSSNHNQQLTSEVANVPSEPQMSRDENNYNEIDRLLEKEKQRNKSDNWNKIDKTVKIQK